MTLLATPKDQWIKKPYKPNTEKPVTLFLLFLENKKRIDVTYKFAYIRFYDKSLIELIINGWKNELLINYCE